MAIRVAVDAMGGDHAPAVVLEGAARAVRQAAGTLEVLLFGPEPHLRDHMDALGVPAALQLLDAPDIIGMAESPVSAVKNKQRSSIHLGLAAQKTKQADAFVSAGNTGAVMAASMFLLGRVPGVVRPSIPGLFPTVKGLTLLLDGGTNVDCKPEHLVQFAKMGVVYASTMFKTDRPTVGLLNIGEEPSKGDELSKEAYKLLIQTADLNFIGNIEGRYILGHAADVIVADGFVGNSLLKFGESVATSLMDMVHQEMERRSLSEEERQLVARVVRGVGQRFNYEEYGGVPLLGVNGNVLIGHGSSSARAIEQLILTAAEVATHNVPDAINAALQG